MVQFVELINLTPYTYNTHDATHNKGFKYYLKGLVFIKSSPNNFVPFFRYFEIMEARLQQTNDQVPTDNYQTLLAAMSRRVSRRREDTKDQRSPMV